jgi:hypothetical protein
LLEVGRSRARAPLVSSMGDQLATAPCYAAAN